MLIIYFKSDGEIHQAAIGYKTLEDFYGTRAREFSLIFSSIYIESNDYVFNNFFEFKVENNKLVPLENSNLKKYGGAAWQI